MVQKESSTKYKSELIRKFVMAAKAATENLGVHKFWPAEAAQIEAYFNCFFSTWFFERYKDDPQKFRQGLKKLRLNHIYFLLYEFIILGLKVAKKFENYPITQKEIVDFAIFIADVAEEKVNEVNDEVFCLKGNNKIITKKKVEVDLKKTRWTEANADNIKEIGKLAAAANSLDWALYFDTYALGGMVVHGPYRYKKDVLLVKDWFDLKPSIWEAQNKYPGLKIYLVYRPIKGLKFDIMNHFTAKEDITKKLTKFSAMSGGKVLNIAQIKKLTAYYNDLTIKQTRHVENLKPVDIITKGAETGYYMYKDFFKYYKRSYRPPKEIYNFIKKQKLKYWNRYKPKQMSLNIALQNIKIFDPRVGFIK